MTGHDLDPAVDADPLATPASGPLLVLVAVGVEARGLAGRLRLPSPPPRSPRLSLQTVGVGAADLPRLGPHLLGLRPAAIIVTGLCGGCAPDLGPGAIVVGSPVGPTAAGAWLTPPAVLTARVLSALDAAALTYRVGRLLTVSGVVSTPEAKAGHWRADGALAVDMESARALAWASDAGVPAIAVRAVADGPAEALPPALLRAVGPGGRVRPSAVLGWAARPARLGAAWRMMRRSRVALDALARFLAAFTAIRP